MAGLWNSKGLSPSSVCTDGTDLSRNGRHQQKSCQKVTNKPAWSCIRLDLKNGAQLQALSKMEGHQQGEASTVYFRGMANATWVRVACWSLTHLGHHQYGNTAFQAGVTTQAQKLIYTKPSGTEEQWWCPLSNCPPHSPKTTAELPRHVLQSEDMAEKKKMMSPTSTLFPQHSVGKGARKTWTQQNGSAGQGKCRKSHPVREKEAVNARLGATSAQGTSNSKMRWCSSRRGMELKERTEYMWDYQN